MVSNTSGKTLLRKAPTKAPAMADLNKAKCKRGRERTVVRERYQYGNKENACPLKKFKYTLLTQWFHDKNQIPIDQRSIGQWMSL
jgi:hypothetical protein